MTSASSNFKSNWENRAGRGVEKSKRPGGLGHAVENPRDWGVLAICVLYLLLPSHSRPTRRENPTGRGLVTIVAV